MADQYVPEDDASTRAEVLAARAHAPSPPSPARGVPLVEAEPEPELVEILVLLRPKVATELEEDGRTAGFEELGAYVELLLVGFAAEGRRSRASNRKAAA